MLLCTATNRLLNVVICQRLNVQSLCQFMKYFFIRHVPHDFNFVNVVLLSSLAVTDANLSFVHHSILIVRFVICPRPLAHRQRQMTDNLCIFDVFHRLKSSPTGKQSYNATEQAEGDPSHSSSSILCRLAKFRHTTGS
jgi:hypothetical protein